MITRISHCSVFVHDQDRARAFYTEKLGWEVRDDVRMGNFRWLTVGPKTQPDLRMVLMPIQPGPNMDEASAAQVRELVSKGTFGIVVESDDIERTYEELRARGVEFVGPPKQMPYGVEAIFRDDSGNFFSLGQRAS